MDWRGGKLTEARLLSQRGGPVVVRYAGRVREYRTRPGERIVFRP